jgi:two-component system chemotaxis response regulator CheB
MPLNAIAQDHPDLVLPVREMAAAIVDLVDRLPEEAEMSDNGHDEMSLEASYAALDAAAVEREDAPGELTPYSCPECWGALWESSENGVPRYRCRVGHAFAADSVVEKQSDSIDQALWMALRALLERAQLTERIAARIRSTNGSEKTAARFDSQSQEAHTQAAVIRRVLLERDASPETP